MWVLEVKWGVRLACLVLSSVLVTFLKDKKSKTYVVRAYAATPQKFRLLTERTQ